MKQRTLSAILIGLLSLLSGCNALDNDIVYSHFERVKDQTWRDSVEYFFSFPVQDLSQEYEVTGVVRFIPTFKLTNLPIGIVSEDADAEAPTFGTTVYNLKTGAEDDKKDDGHFVLRETSFRIEKRRTYKETGVYTYSFRQLTDTAAIEGVAEVGLIVRKSKQNRGNK